MVLLDNYFPLCKSLLVAFALLLLDFDTRKYHGQALDFKSRNYQNRTTFDDLKKNLPKVENGHVVSTRSIAYQTAD